MNIFSATNPQSIDEATTVLRAGGIIVYPTDTLYGLGVDASNAYALKKLRDLKQRQVDNALPIAVSNKAMAEEYADFSPFAQRLAEIFWPGALTLVLPQKMAFPPELIGEKKDIGMRMPDSTFVQELVEHFGKPITSTSANMSGEEGHYTIESLIDALSDRAALVDLYIDGGELVEREASTVVGVRENDFEIFREGAITREMIANIV